MMRWRIILLAAVLALAAAPRSHAAADQQDHPQIERGRYLAIVGDCAACHTESGGPPYAGGNVLQTPFGKLLGPNLTPDNDTGIGAWSDDEFVNALLQGTGHGGQHLYPAMPYTYFTRMTREDALAIRAFLATLAPVHHRVKSNQLPFPFNIRAGVAAWNRLYFKPGRFQPDKARTDEWNRGAFLVQGPGHCGMCHTPKTTLGGDETDHALRGGMLQGWLAPDLTGDARVGLGDWTVADIVQYLHDGRNARTAATGPMAEVVSDSTSHISTADLRAIAVYLKSLPAAAGAPPQAVAANDPAMRTGHAIYLDNCSACHVGNGSGLPGLFPALRDNSNVQHHSAVDLIHVMLAGAGSVATDAAPTAPAMPSFGWKLSDAEVAATLTYIRNSWGNHASAVSAADVSAARRDQHDR